MSMWDKAEEMAEKASEGGMFLKLSDDGDTAEVVFCGEPMPREVVWTGTTYEPYDPDKHDGKPSLKVKVNCWNCKENSMQIWEMSAKVFKQIVKLKKKYGLDKKTFEIVRSGKKGDTQTTYMILPENDITADMLERINAEQLHDLSEDGKPSASAGGGNRELLMTILKKLPRNKLDAFLSKMEVKKVKDIPANKLIAALELAEAMSKADDGDVDDDQDPFA